MICCEPHMNQSAHHSQRFPSQMSCRTPLKACKSWTTLSKQASAHNGSILAIGKHANQNLLPGSSLGGLRDAPTASGENLCAEFSPRNIAFQNSRFQDRTSTKKIREAFPEMRRPSSKQFVHSLMHVLSQAVPSF